MTGDETANYCEWNFIKVCEPHALVPFFCVTHHFACKRWRDLSCTYVSNYCGTCLFDAVRRHVLLHGRRSTERFAFSIEVLCEGNWCSVTVSRLSIKVSCVLVTVNRLSIKVSRLCQSRYRVFSSELGYNAALYHSRESFLVFIVVVFIRVNCSDEPSLFWRLNDKFDDKVKRLVGCRLLAVCQRRWVVISLTHY